jgi:hypothetical protein
MDEERVARQAAFTIEARACTRPLPSST